jgi:hypothetical protein
MVHVTSRSKCLVVTKGGERNSQWKTMASGRTTASLMKAAWSRLRWSKVLVAQPVSAFGTTPS